MIAISWVGRREAGEFLSLFLIGFLSEKEEEDFFGNAARRSELRVEGKKFNALKNKRARRFNGSRSILL